MHIIKETAHLEQWAVEVSYLDGTSDLHGLLGAIRPGHDGATMENALADTRTLPYLQEQ